MTQNLCNQFNRILLGTIVLATSLAAQSSDTTSEAWQKLKVFVKLNENTRLYGLYSATKQEDLGAYADGQTGLHIDFYGVRPLWRPPIEYVDKSKSKFLMLRAGYLYSRPKNNSGSQTENMVDLEATARAHLWSELQLIERNRFDLRWEDGAPRHRYRNRLKVERRFRKGKLELTPYAYGEVFYDLRKLEWNRFRYAAGSEWTVQKWLVLEGYYLRQNTWGSKPQFVNVLGVTLQVYIR
ncbi:MAG: DUF2490 domain-containing protein [Acidobacteria bacterium]|nr:DUF2490 domain-containing protein [Acidobacteriota bacterium]